ncbi:MAG: bifunctional 4-hydroxy-2-oxoglutarate aldolase/2-dehydro-3-deoxy-phosphogluconate aldolase [Clostridia bacterium]|nr:bifunctional 4-hydroxy-2-oxoglutarate aldolase/2-dehydro-3-deoxy-phosphogluconate aldolase [Clostridia bacterium]
MNKQQVIDTVKREKIVVIVRGIARDKLCALCEALYKGGIRLIEVTFDAKGIVTDEQTAENIAMLVREFEGKLCIGAGTVMNEKQARLAIDAGAKYLISPNVSKQVIAYAVVNGAVSMPGAMTPSEIVDAYEAGADFVKVFPAETLGLAYIKAIRAPLSHIPMLAVGGVNENNIADFMAAGIDGVGIGSNIVKKAMVESGDFEGITRLAKTYTDALK